MKYTLKSAAKSAALLLCAAMLLSTVSACRKTVGEPQSQASQVQENSGAQSSQSSAEEIAQPDLSGATKIILSGGSASVEGKGAVAEGSVVTITEGGAYTASGSLEDGRVIVNAPKQDVTLALEGVDITCSYGSPLYIYKASTATVHLAEGTENKLTDGNAYTYADTYSSAADEEPNACLYSKADLIIAGTGKLTVTANFDNGITSKDTLLISGSTISVRAVDNGINGKDSNTIDRATITVSCGGDAIRSTNDTDGALGWVRVSDSTLDLTAGEDGIQAETALSVSGGSCTITSGGGSGVRPSEDTSAKGLKAGTSLDLTGGSYVLDCSDDAVHANGDVTVSGGTYTVSTGDDAFHTDEALAVTEGEIDVKTSYEGLEGTTVEISGGTIRIVASDDGVNAAGGVDGSEFGGFGRGNAFGGAIGAANPNSHIDISGGYLVVAAGGDGLDSNGSMTMSGGTVVVSSTGQGDGALDYESSFTLEGGVLLAAGSANMAQAPSQASQYTVSLGLDSMLPAGTYVSLAGEGESFVFQLPAAANHMVVSLPGLVGGAEYTVSYGGEYSGQSVNGLCSGGEYSGGTELARLTLSDSITIYGNAGMGGSGPMGGWPGGGDLRGNPGEIPGEMPGEGEAPDRDGMQKGPWDRDAQGGMGRGKMIENSEKRPEESDFPSF